MIPLVGLIVAAYAICRLLQVPAEAVKSDSSGRIIWLSIVSLIGILTIGVLAVILMFSGSSTASSLQRLGS